MGPGREGAACLEDPVSLLVGLFLLGGNVIGLAWIKVSPGPASHPPRPWAVLRRALLPSLTHPQQVLSSKTPELLSVWATQLTLAHGHHAAPRPGRSGVLRLHECFALGGCSSSPEWCSRSDSGAGPPGPVPRPSPSLLGLHL